MQVRWNGALRGRNRGRPSPALRLRCPHSASRGRAPRGAVGNTALPTGTARALRGAELCWCPSWSRAPALQGRAVPLQESFEGSHPAQPDLPALLRSVADLFLLIFKYQVYLVYS